MQIQKRGELVKLLHHFSLPFIIAEVGCAEGRFSKQIYDWGVKKLYLIDLWEEMPFIPGCASFGQVWHDENYKQVLKEFGSKGDVEIMKGFSHKMATRIEDASVSLIYIDSDHTYDGVKSDIRIWWEKLVPGGIMAFHDYHDNGNYGVQRAVIEFMKGETQINIIPEDGNTENRGAWIRK